MLLNSATAVVAFVVFVAPGVVWSWLAERRRAALPRSSAVEAGLLAVTSVAFSLPALLTTFGIIWVFDRDLSSVDSWLTGDTPTARRVAGAAGTLVVLLVLSLLLVAVVYRTVGPKLLGARRLNMVSAWTDVLDESCPEGCEPMAELRLKDGSTVRGIVGPYTRDHELADRELILGPPIVHEHEGKLTFGLRPSPDRLVVSGLDITSMSIRYLTTTDVEAARAALRRSAPDHAVAS